MADEADIAQQREQYLTDSALAASRLAAQNIPKGEPGECGLCGEESPRLVAGACARCRDKRRGR
jgi:hypothetical protein